MDFNINDIGNISNNYNSKYLLVLPEIQDALFWMKEINLPDISIESFDIPQEPQYVKEKGLAFSYGDISAVFFLDEYFKSLKIIYDWMMLGKAGTNWEDNKENGSIYILDNQFREPVFDAQFRGFFPTAITELSYNNYSSEPQTFTVTLTYDKYTPNFLKIS